LVLTAPSDMARLTRETWPHCEMLGKPTKVPEAGATVVEDGAVAGEVAEAVVEVAEAL